MNSDRRRLLKLLGLGSTGLFIDISWATDIGAESNSIQPNAFLYLTDNNQLHIILPQVEMGQGVTMGFCTLIAEELELSPADIITHAAPVDPALINPKLGNQATGASTSMAVRYLPLRRAAAQLRQLLLQAAAKQLGTSVENLSLKDGKLINKGKAYHYGRFVATAKTLRIPSADNVPLKNSKHFNLIGKAQTRVDALDKITGRARYGVDIYAEDLHYAAVKRAPVRGGKVKRFSADETLAQPGVKQVVEIFSGVAVIADSWWLATQALNTLIVEWDMPDAYPNPESSLIEELNSTGSTVIQEGKTTSQEAMRSTMQGTIQSTMLSADYSAPYLAHAMMEPLSCTIRLEGRKATVWAGSQITDVCQRVAAKHLKIPAANISIKTPTLGGGFGRRLNHDFVAETAAIAKATKLPVKLQWTREDDIRHDYYRPASAARMRAQLDDNGQLLSWTAKRAGADTMHYAMDEQYGDQHSVTLSRDFQKKVDRFGESFFKHYGGGHDRSSSEGLWEDYDCPHKEVQLVRVNSGPPTGSLRSVGYSANTFFKESFADELALHAGVDPVAWRLQHLQGNPRLANVLKEAALQADWESAEKNGRNLGVAAATSFDTHVAQIVDVSVQQNEITVHRVVCVVDCGLVINPDIVKAQMEGSIVFALSAALYGEISLQNGAVSQSNFHDYQLLRMNEMPQIDVHIIDSDAAPSGVGEPGVPPLAPALANALYKASGKRLRSLPLRL